MFAFGRESTVVGSGRMQARGMDHEDILAAHVTRPACSGNRRDFPGVPSVYGLL